MLFKVIDSPAPVPVPVPEPAPPLFTISAPPTYRDCVSLIRLGDCVNLPFLNWLIVSIS